MRKDEALGLFLRCLGAWVFVQGFLNVSALLAIPAGLFVIAPQFIAGVVLFFGAGYFVGMTYGPPPEDVAGES